MNSVEKKAIGTYVVGSYTLKTDTSNNVNLPMLYLRNDKTFTLKYEHKHIEGRWEAEDYYEFVLIDFTSKEGMTERGNVRIQFGKNVEIKIGAPYDYYFPNFEKITFKKIDTLNTVLPEERRKN